MSVIQGPMNIFIDMYVFLLPIPVIMGVQRGEVARSDWRVRAGEYSETESRKQEIRPV